MSGPSGDAPRVPRRSPAQEALGNPAAASHPRGPLAAIDPGRSKCGLVISDPQARTILVAAVLPPERALERLRQWQEQHAPLVAVLLGNGTGSGAWRPWLAAIAPLQLVPEAGTTLAARQRYWQLEPAQGWRRLLPPGLRQPPRDWDDVVAQLLLERHLGRELPRRLTPEANASP